MLPSTLLIRMENKGVSMSEIALALSRLCVYLRQT
jgi:hypothetical protein